MIAVVVSWFADHLPLLNLGLAIEVFDVGKNADVSSVHL